MRFENAGGLSLRARFRPGSNGKRFGEVGRDRRNLIARDGCAGADHADKTAFPALLRPTRTYDPFKAMAVLAMLEDESLFRCIRQRFSRRFCGQNRARRGSRSAVRARKDQRCRKQNRQNQAAPAAALRGRRFTRPILSPQAAHGHLQARPSSGGNYECLPRSRTDRVSRKAHRSSS